MKLTVWVQRPPSVMGVTVEHNVKEDDEEHGCQHADGHIVDFLECRPGSCKPLVEDEHGGLDTPQRNDVECRSRNNDLREN